MKPAICLVTYDRGQPPDAILAEVVRRLTGSAVRVGGLLQSDDGTAAPGATLFLQNIGSGRRVRIFEERGPAARGCRLASYGLAEAAAWLDAAIETRPEVVFVNRFGREEAAGRGLLSGIATAVVAGLPLVVPLDRTLLTAWDGFAGDVGARLPPNPDGIEAWCRARTVASTFVSGCEEALEGVKGDAPARGA